MKIEIDLNNVIQSKDQVRPGMHLWSVGQGGVSGVTKPTYVGQVIGFGWSNYTFEEGAETATGFVIEESEDEFVALVTRLNGKPEDFNVPEEGFKQGVNYNLGDVQKPFENYGKVFIISRSYLPRSYNNWYMCDSEEKAQAVYEEMLAQWNNAHEKARAEYERDMEYLRADDYL